MEFTAIGWSMQEITAPSSPASLHQRVADLAEFHLYIPRLPHQHNNTDMIGITNPNSTKDAQQRVAVYAQVWPWFVKLGPSSVPLGQNSLLNRKK
jgi:hypothetical protein